MYVTLNPRSSSRSDSDPAFLRLPHRIDPYSNSDGTGRYGVDAVLHNRLSKWNRVYKNISLPIVMAVQIIPNHGVPVQSWLTQFMFGNETEQSINTPSVHDGWFNPRPDGAGRHFDAIWAFTGLSPALMLYTRHQLYVNPLKPNSLIPVILSKFASSSIMSDSPPSDIGNALNFDYSKSMLNMR